MKHSKFSAALAVGATSALLALGIPHMAQAGTYTLTLNGSPIEESLTSEDDQLQEDGSYYDSYTFQGQAGQQIRITMSSQEIDAYLILLDPNGNSLVQDDNSGGGADAEIVIELPMTGTYTILANSFAGWSTGSYRLQATIGGASGPTPQPVPNGTTTTTLPRYFCNTSGSVPITMARSRHTGTESPLIHWTSNWAPPPYTPSERCALVSERLSTLHGAGTLALTAGRLNGQPVVCAAQNVGDAQQGVCAPNGLVLTVQNREEARTVLRGLQESFSAIVARGSSPGIVYVSGDAVHTLNNDVPYLVIRDF